MRTACPGMLGNFNLIVSTEHKNSGTVNRAMMGRFRRLISVLELKNLPLLVPKYTWSNYQGSPTLVKLDRVLCSMDWEQLFPNYLLQSCATDSSDHALFSLALMMSTSERLDFILKLFGQVWKDFKK